MTTTLAVLINDHLLLPCVCDRMATALGSLAGPTAADTGASTAPAPLHAGVGLHQDGEVLLARRPLQEGQNLHSLFCQSDTNILLAHLEPAGTRSFQTHTMQPYRFKDWLWACSDDLTEAPGFDRQGLAIPGHLRENMRAGTPAETLFHLFLAFLHSAGQLGRLQWNRSALRQALRAALTHVPAHFVPRGGGGGGPTCAVFATNGEILLAAGLGRPLYLQTVGGIAECARCEDALNLGRARRRTVAHAHVKAFLVSDSPLQSDAAETNVEMSTLPPGTLLDISVAADVCTVPLSE